MTTTVSTMTRVPARLLRLCAVLAAACALWIAAAPAAHAAGGNAVINDCQSHNGTLAGHYSAAQLQQALKVMPAYMKQYSSCYDVINSALAHAKHPSGSAGSGSGGSFLPTPVIVILVVLVLGAVGYGVLAVRSRRGPSA